MIENKQDPGMSYDLHQYGYRFAIRNIERKYGRIEAFKVRRFADEASGEMLTLKDEIPMVTCDQIEEREDRLHIFRASNLRTFQNSFLNGT